LTVTSSRTAAQGLVRKDFSNGYVCVKCCCLLSL
jgi:hypothetical protein